MHRIAFANSFALTRYTPGNSFLDSRSVRQRPRGIADAGGGVAQLGERLNGIQEVRGSIPLASTPGLLSRE